MSSKKKKIVKQNGLALTPQYYESVKYNLWVKNFLNVRDKTTFGNRTQSALRAYNLDPETQYDSATTIGRENYGKLRNISSQIMEKLGFNFADLMQIGAKKMMEGDYEDWEKFMTRLGYFEKDDKPNQPGPTVNVQNIINEWK